MFAQIITDENDQGQQIEKINSIHVGAQIPKYQDGTLLGDYRPVEENNVTFNSVTQFIEKKPNSEWTIESDRVIVTYNIINKDLSEEKQKLLDQIKQIRNKTIFNGISVTINGQTLNIKSDNETISRVDQARLDSKERPTNWKKRWKFASGVWADIDATQIETIRSKIADHVEASFQNEEQLENQINNATSIQDLSNIDINSGWPNN
mgnify:CR=1 FL=1